MVNDPEDAGTTTRSASSTAVLDDPGIPSRAFGRGEEWDPALAETLYRSLPSWMDLDSREIDAELAGLETTHGSELYAELIYLLSHLRFPGESARRYWRDIISLRDRMQERLGVVVDVRVALASYFVQVNRKLRNPKIIELQVFEQTRASAYRDELTGLHNYRFFAESLEHEIPRALRTNQPVSLVMVDLDSFKEINDRFGHDTGNEVLAATARLLVGAVRPEDLVTRYGGEEFAVILPATPKPGARLVADRARAAIEAHQFPHLPGGGQGRVTVSMGVATCPGDTAQGAELVRCADRALYVAKSAGKNQVQIYGQSRRSFRRVCASIEGRYRPSSGTIQPLTTLDLSEGGLSFSTDQPPLHGTLIEVHLSLPGSTGEITTAGRVVRVTERPDGSFEACVRILHTETADRLALSRLVGDLRRKDERCEDAPRS